MKKSLRILEAIASTSLMLSKYFLALGSVWGWWLSILGYILTSFFNVKIKLKAVAGIVAGLAVLSAYGLYKWTYYISGLQLFDWIVIIVSLILSIILIIKEVKTKRPYWMFQAIGIIAFAFAFITLGMKMEIGWYVLLIGHINNTYLYYKKEAYIISVMQVVSIVIVLVKIF
ncbi:MAG: nicotinamide mononucleotide transporter [Patescibacteria group bacterium]|nr:nicotinamide mononucleotide transporter [Patescibacteria group bacterium]